MTACSSLENPQQVPGAEHRPAAITEPAVQVQGYRTLALFPPLSPRTRVASTQHPVIWLVTWGK